MSKTRQGSVLTAPLVIGCVSLYRRMEGIFQQASDKLSDTKDLRAARSLLAKLGEAALAENSDWVLLHRERPLELPHP